MNSLFDVAIVDDANLVPEIELLVALNEIRPSRMVLVGDA